MLDPRPHGCVPSVGVLGHVRQRLGHDEVGGRLDREREPRHADVDLDRDRCRSRERRHRGAQAAEGEDGREDAVGKLAQLLGGGLRVLERLADQPRRVASAPLEGTGRELQGHHRADQPLLGSIVKIAHDAAALLVRGGDDSNAGGGEIRTALHVCDRGRHNLGERADARLGLRGHGDRPRRRDRDHTPETSVDDDRAPDRGPQPGPLSRRGDLARRAPVVVEACRPAGPVDPRCDRVSLHVRPRLATR